MRWRFQSRCQIPQGACSTDIRGIVLLRQLTASSPVDTASARPTPPRNSDPEDRKATARPSLRGSTDQLDTRRRLRWWTLVGNKTRPYRHPCNRNWSIARQRHRYRPHMLLQQRHQMDRSALVDMGLALPSLGGTPSPMDTQLARHLIQRNYDALDKIGIEQPWLHTSRYLQEQSSIIKQRRS